MPRETSAHKVAASLPGADDDPITEKFDMHYSMNTSILSDT